ncbi:penicillin-binding protein 1A [Chlorobaculum sp. 24CR]|uniref:penicillin-binding protein 1A n=1 Tax=Chlorobaculum sp. 24CR TaxID=2508878 RepID=UPI00143128BE|nr:PBP1A family penicillin-binding protein [Chlorobaculum sp. 24CR]
MKVAGLLLVVLLGASAVFGLGLFKGLPSIAELENPRPELASLVYSEDGKLLHKFFLKNRTFVPLRSISRWTPAALIATEDITFYQHWGVDLRRLGIAFGENIIKGRTRWQGASTITQQLAKNLFLTQERTLSRKAKEFVTAIELERTYTKDEILALYLNTVYFGSGAYGIESAAQTYFGKPASKLTIPESATLIATLKNPTAYDPSKDPSSSLARRNLIIGLMEKEKFITHAQAVKAKATPLVLHYTPVSHQGLAPYFTEYIRQTVKSGSMLDGVNVYRDGLTIQTTLDSRMQQYAQQAIANQAAYLQAQFDKTWRCPESLKMQFIKESARYKEMVGEEGVPANVALARLKADSAWLNNLLHQKTRVQMALVALDPTNGHVKAWVGGTNFGPDDYRYQFDHVWQARRQPGSAFKPFVYAAAIDKGIPANYRILDQPLALRGGDGRVWMARNSEGDSGGMTTLREALAHSLNQVTVRLAYEFLSPSEIISYARRMGISSPMQPNLSIALGTSEVSPLELARAYTSFANNGVWSDVLPVLKVLDKNGHVIAEHQPSSHLGLDPATNFVMVSILKDVIDRGTGIAARARYGLDMEVAGKTGTTQSQRDAWFAGFTPQLVTVVWAGFDDERVHFTSMSYGQGARAALPAWANFMKQCYSDASLKFENRYFPMPDNVIAVPMSGASSDAAGVLSQNVFVEYFTPKGYARTQVGDFNRTPQPVNSGAVGNPDSTGVQQAPVPQVAPADNF